MSTPTLLGVASVPTQPLQTTPVTILYRLSNPFSSPAPVSLGATGLGGFSAGDSLFATNVGGATTGGAFAVLPAGPAGAIITSNGTQPQWTNELVTINGYLNTLAAANADIASASASIFAESAGYQTTIAGVDVMLVAASTNLNNVSALAYAQDAAIAQAQTNAGAIAVDLTPLTAVNAGINAVDNAILSLNTQAAATSAGALALASTVAGVQSNMTHLASSLTSFGEYKNKVINGAFRVWQRNAQGYSGVIDGSTVQPHMYLAPDRWAVNAPIGTTVVLTPASATLPAGSFSGLSASFAEPVGGSALLSLSQYIEGAGTLQGRPAVLSFWACGPASTITVSVTQLPASGAAVPALSAPLALTTAWTQFSFPMTVPAVASAEGSLVLSFGSAAGWSMQLARVQLEEGTAPSEFEYRPMAIETRLCERYYEVGAAHMMGFGAGGNATCLTSRFKVQKRVQPAVTVGVGIQSGFTLSASVVSLSTAALTLGLAKAISGDGTFTLNWTASAEI